MRDIFHFIKDRYVNPAYPFRDRLYFMFGTAGVLSAGAAFFAAIFSGLPRSAAAASLVSFFVMLLLMAASFFMKEISLNRVLCAAFLNFLMFPSLFWVTGGINCGMIFYFMLGLSVATLTLAGKLRAVVLTLTLALDTACLALGFQYPQFAYQLSYEERKMDTISSFIIVSLFIIAVIIIMAHEYQKEHDKVLAHAAQLKLQADTDNLTTLYNRRFLLERLEAHVASAGTAAVSIAMFDIDDFKRINDQYGHLCGDQVLHRFAVLLKSGSVENQFATRYGGEEFIVVFPGAVRAEAMAYAEKIRLAAYADEALKKLTHGHFSVSGGVAQLTDGMTAGEWINVADENLYSAKRLGKNRIVG